MKDIKHDECSLVKSCLGTWDGGRVGLTGASEERKFTTALLQLERSNVRHSPSGEPTGDNECIDNPHSLDSNDSTFVMSLVLMSQTCDLQAPVYTARPWR